MTAASADDPIHIYPNGRSLLAITTADLIVRSAYQMGKTPLLPIFAASLGAGDVFLGLIVSVSTLTGMILKPFIGILSDRWGRAKWLIGGTILFAMMPFFYRFVHTPEQLFAIRMVHGLATAIYGPVTLAFVAEQAQPNKRAIKFGLFSLGRSAGYILGPAAAGWLLMRMEPEQVFTIIGLMSCLAFLPLLFLGRSRAVSRKASLPAGGQIRMALQSASKTPAIWISGGLDATVFIALYALKAFLPIYGVTLGMSIFQVGFFFSVQEAASMILKPLGGCFGDRFGHLKTIALGMLLYALALPLLTWAPGMVTMMILAVVFGSAQALVFPATSALVSNHVDPDNLGAGLGLTGALNNSAKVAGPILGGFLVAQFDFAQTLQLLGLMLLLGGGVVLLSIRLQQRRLPKGFVTIERAMVAVESMERPNNQ
jgi:MFS family permease